MLCPLIYYFLNYLLPTNFFSFLGLKINDIYYHSHIIITLSL